MSTQNTQCMEQKTLSEAKQDLVQAMKAMGMDEGCQKAALTAWDSGSLGGSADALFGLFKGKIGGQFQSSSNEMKQDGKCGQSLLNLNENLNNFQSISCSLLQNTTTVNLGQITTQKISIRNENPEPDENTAKLIANMQADAKDIYDKAQQNAFDAAKNGASKSTLDFLKQLVSDAKDIYDKAMSRRGNVNITDSTLTNKVNAEISIAVSMNDDQKAAIEKDLTNQIKQAADQKLKTNLGLNALGEQATAAIQQSTIDKKNLISNIIQSTTKGLSATTTNEGNITIINKTGGDITLAGVTLNNEFMPRMISGAMFSAGQSMADDIVSKILTDQSSKQIAEGKSAGLNDLARELGKANTDALDTVTKSSKGIFGVIIAVFALMVFGSFAKKGGSPEAKQKTQYAMSFLLIVVGASLFGGGTYLKKSGDKGDKGVLATLKGVGTGLITYSGAALIVFGLIGIFWAKMTGPTSDEAASRSSDEAASRSSGEPSASITMVD